MDYCNIVVWASERCLQKGKDMVISHQTETTYRAALSGGGRKEEYPRGLFARETAGAAAALLLFVCVHESVCICVFVCVRVSVCICEIKFNLIQ